MLLMPALTHLSRGPPSIKPLTQEPVFKWSEKDVSIWARSIGLPKEHHKCVFGTSALQCPVCGPLSGVQCLHESFAPAIGLSHFKVHVQSVAIIIRMSGTTCCDAQGGVMEACHMIQSTVLLGAIDLAQVCRMFKQKHVSGKVLLRMEDKHFVNLSRRRPDDAWIALFRRKLAQLKEVCRIFVTSDSYAEHSRTYNTHDGCRRLSFQMPIQPSICSSHHVVHCT